MSILFVGRANLGGAQMRGRDVASRMGETFRDWEHLPAGPLDTVVVVKYWAPQIRDIRKRCRLLIHDPLDCFSQTHPKMTPEQFWSWCYGEVQPDVMLATSPACSETMNGCGAKIMLAPHHADERVGTDWYDPRGPVVYAGGERFLGDEAPRIAAACRELGRDFVARFDKECWQALKGVALSLCVRFGKERTPLNLICKPAVKVANACRSGIPIVATPDDAIATLNCSFEKAVSTERGIADAISDGLRRPAFAFHYPWTLDTHCELLRNLAG